MCVCVCAPLLACACTCTMIENFMTLYMYMYMYFHITKMPVVCIQSNSISPLLLVCLCVTIQCASLPVENQMPKHPMPFISCFQCTELVNSFKYLFNELLNAIPLMFDDSFHILSLFTLCLSLQKQLLYILKRKPLFICD